MSFRVRKALLTFPWRVRIVARIFRKELEHAHARRSLRIYICEGSSAVDREAEVSCRRCHCGFNGGKCQRIPADVSLVELCV